MTEPASRRYKEIIAGVAAAAEELRHQDRKRAAALAGELVDLEAGMLAAGRRADLTAVGVELRWEAAMDALWTESWLALRPQPVPDPTADPAQLDELDREVDRCAAELQEAVRRRRFGFPRR